MQGKQIEEATMEAVLTQFLGGEQRLILGFEKTPTGARHRLFKGSVENLTLFNPTFDVNGALYLRRLFSKGAKVMLILRPCEIRAYSELTKLTQVEREAIIAVSVDCFGAVSSKDKPENLPSTLKELKDYFKDPDTMRIACRTCRERRGVVGDAGIRIGKDGGLWACAYTPTGEEFVDLFDGTEAEIPQPLLPESLKGAKFQTDMGQFAKDFETCIMCKNCRDMCPVCYCIDCVFNGDEYLPKGDALLNKIFRTGSTDMPQGKEVFHLIRMFHVSQVCVGCGSCEEACPQSIPLTKYFKGVSERLQDMFSYMSGRDFDDIIPYLTFQEDELKDAED
jgi:formate dehydrogenase (coenzyme F420) beta subunit